jgi:hypothetical protein
MVAGPACFATRSQYGGYDDAYRGQTELPLLYRLTKLEQTLLVCCWGG